MNLFILSENIVEPRLTVAAFYDHLILARTKPQSVIFIFKETLRYGQPVNTARFFWAPVGDRISEVPLQHKTTLGLCSLTKVRTDIHVTYFRHFGSDR